MPAAPVLPPKVTTPLEVRFRPLLLGSSEASLKLDSAELGLYEWKLKLTGAPTMPERPLTFSVPLGTREVQVRRVHGCWEASSCTRTCFEGFTSSFVSQVYALCSSNLLEHHLVTDSHVTATYLGVTGVLLLQVLHFMHWGQDRAEYKCSFKSSSGAAAAGGVAASSTDFDAPASVVAPPAGPTGTDIEVAVGFEPCALGEAVRDTLVLTSATSGVYEVPLMGQCVPPKPQGPVDVSKVSRGLVAHSYYVCMHMHAVTACRNTSPAMAWVQRWDG